jgi:TIR domain
MAEQVFDVAISFLVRDERTAAAIAERLESAGLKVFYFPHRQEELAGTNGMESMRAPFMDARVNVVLFRKTWGETPWTRVEDGAISERCFRGGWSSLMFVELEKSAPLPKWLPGTHIRFNFADYGIDQLVGAIKLRIQEQGGTIKPLDALGKAKAVKSEADYLADRDRLMRDRGWIEWVHNSIRETLAVVGALAKELREEHGLDVVFGTQDRMGVLRTGFVSVGIGWKQPIFNYVGDHGGDECYLRVAEFSGLLALPGEQRWYLEAPKVQKEWKFKVDVARDRSLVWRLGTKEEIPASQLADRIVQIFLDLVSRANRGKVEPPHL